MEISLEGTDVTLTVDLKSVGTKLSSILKPVTMGTKMTMMDAVLNVDENSVVTALSKVQNNAMMRILIHQMAVRIAMSRPVVIPESNMGRHVTMVTMSLGMDVMNVYLKSVVIKLFKQVKIVMMAILYQAMAVIETVLLRFAETI